MYIACPKCNTKFVVTSEQVGKHGRKVKCSKCAHIWHQTPDTKVDIPPLLTPTAAHIPLGNGVNLPALVPVRIQPYLYAMPILIIGLIIFMLVMLFPANFGFNSLLSNRNLSIKDLQIQNQTELEKITVSYKVHNSAYKNTKMPLVRIRLLDKNNRVIKSLIDDHTNIVMSPNQFIQVKTEFAPAPASADNVDIMIGNRIDFILR
jgi:predicted Zn finger-like uncharacterized protein